MPAMTVPFKEEDYLLFFNEFREVDEGYALLFAIGCHTPYKLSEILNAAVSDFLFNINEQGGVLCRKELDIKKMEKVTLPDEILNLVESYLINRLDRRRKNGLKDYTFTYEPMFLTSSNKLVSEQGFSKMLYRIKKRNEIIEAYSSISMRKTYYKKMCEIIGINATAKLMHRSVGQASAYLGINLKTKK